MVTLSRKNKIAITTMIVIAAVLAIALPLANAQTTNNAVSNIKTLKAQGNIYQTIDSNTIKYYPASLTLTLQPTSTTGPVKKFDITGGTLVANGVSYTFASGNGAVLTGRHVVLMQAQGTSPDGQAVTLKLAGQYSWLGGSTLRIGAKLQTQDATYTLLMRAPI
jgi:hypothetical protein